MSINCTRCEGTGFLNADQIPNNLIDKGTDDVVSWLDNIAFQLKDS